MHALVRFTPIAAGDPFPMPDLHGLTAAALDTTTAQYRLASLRDDLSKLRAKGLVERVPHSRRYRLLPHGSSIPDPELGRSSLELIMARSTARRWCQ